MLFALLHDSPFVSFGISSPSSGDFATAVAAVAAPAFTAATTAPAGGKTTETAMAPTARIPAPAAIPSTFSLLGNFSFVTSWEPPLVFVVLLFIPAFTLNVVCVPFESLVPSVTEVDVPVQSVSITALLSFSL